MLVVIRLPDLFGASTVGKEMACQLIRRAAEGDTLLFGQPVAASRSEVHTLFCINSGA